MEAERIYHPHISAVIFCAYITGMKQLGIYLVVPLLEKGKESKLKIVGFETL